MRRRFGEVGRQDADTAATVAGCADAVVVGSALVDFVANDLIAGGSHDSAISEAYSLISSIRNGVNLATSN